MTNLVSCPYSEETPEIFDECEWEWEWEQEPWLLITQSLELREMFQFQFSTLPRNLELG
jgi:hypothetical protein